MWQFADRSILLFGFADIETRIKGSTAKINNAKHLDTIFFLLLKMYGNPRDDLRISNLLRI